LARMTENTRLRHLEIARRWVDPGDKPFIRNV
jgi:hypothetical protein